MDDHTDNLDGPLAPSREDHHLVERAFEGVSEEPTERADLLSLLNTDATRQRTRADELATQDDEEPDRNADFWAYRAKNLTIEDLLPARCLVAWRLVRRICADASILGEAEPLSKLDAVNDWRRPLMLPYGEIHRARMLSERARMRDPATGKVVEGVSMCVPPKTDDPEEQLLKLWIELMKRLGEGMLIRRGGTDIDFELTDAFKHITTPSTARESWPTLGQIELFEDCLVKETLMGLVESSLLQTESTIIRKYGLSPQEARTLTRLARAEAREFSEFDPEEQRGLLVLQVEDIKRRAKDAFDYRAEIAAVKQISGLLGLEQTDASNPFKEMVDIIKDESSKRKPVENTAGQQGLPEGE